MLKLKFIFRILFNFVKERTDFKTRAIIVLFIFSAIFAVLTVFYYKEASVLRNNPQKMVEKEVKDVVTRVARHMFLPEGEIPNVATVVDPDTLKKGQPFFNNAKKGDKVLIYASALKAILYNPETDKIVDVASLNTAGVRR